MIVKYRAANDPELAGTEPCSDFTFGLSEILSDREFSNMFDKKPNAKDFNWKAVEYIQACVKDSIGIGKLLKIEFYAPLDESDDVSASKEIAYDRYKLMPDELQLL